ncbi:Protein NRT1/ PTR family 2.11 [Vitis vinifera]|uniref:Protein NRT1/ PTR family 2.11 n=1 Tax=Vitis vinifera TaxID=29760 RepID=A0A438I384_VITVI|nr:Protein NRT1/ PTR family 2.11 [Vitis vinifera]
MENNEKVVATDEPKTKHRGIKAMPFVIGNETFEKLGTIGTSTNLLVYLTTVFNMKSITATTFVNVFNGSTNFATLIGAFLCDTYFGRYTTLGFASISSFLVLVILLMGMLVITLTAAVQKMHPPHCGTTDTGTCIGPTAGQMAFLLSGFGLLVIGAAGIRPCNLAFGADQFNPETESGKRGISSFFNWYYFTYTFAMMVSLTVIVYVQSDVKPEGSPLKNVAQVIVAAVKKRRLELPGQPWLSLFNHIPANSINSKLPHTDQFRQGCKRSELIPQQRCNPNPEVQINSDGSAANPWRLSSMQKVEEVKCVIRVIPIWAAGIIYYVALVQQSTYVVFQALQSDRRLGSTGFKIQLHLTLLTGKEVGITLLQKMGIGMVLAVITMILSALVEERRRTLALTKATVGIEARRGAISSLSGMWLVPQLTLIGISEGLTIIGQVEFFYKQFPENMRSFAGAFLFCGIAFSNYLSSFLVSIVHQSTGGTATGNWLPEDLNKGRLDYFYYLVAALGMVNLLYFLACAKWYKYKDSEESPLEVSLEKMQPQKPLV